MWKVPFYRSIASHVEDISINYLPCVQANVTIRHNCWKKWEEEEEEEEDPCMSYDLVSNIERNWRRTFHCTELMFFLYYLMICTCLLFEQLNICYQSKSYYTTSNKNNNLFHVITSLSSVCSFMWALGITMGCLNPNGRRLILNVNVH
jgi:hypothetical protein